MPLYSKSASVTKLAAPKNWIAVSLVCCIKNAQARTPSFLCFFPASRHRLPLNKHLLPPLLLARSCNKGTLQRPRWHLVSHNRTDGQAFTLGLAMTWPPLLPKCRIAMPAVELTARAAAAGNEEETQNLSPVTNRLWFQYHQYLRHLGHLHRPRARP